MKPSKLNTVWRYAKIISALSILSVLISVGCSKSDDSDLSGDDVSLRVETSGVETLSSEAGIELILQVTPANLNFSYSNGKYNAKLYYSANKGAMQEAYISTIVAAGSGRYKVTISDRSSGKKFHNNVCIGVTTSGEGSKTYFSNTFALQNYEMDMGLASINFYRQDNPQLANDIHCDYDEATQTFVGRSTKVRGGLIDPSQLVATFVASGDVTVNGKEQQSGVTANDFTQPVTYKVSANGKTKEYSVQIINFTGLPVVYINSSTGQSPINRDITSKTQWKDAVLRIEGNGIFDDLDEVPLQLRGRGNVTWNWDKKAFNIKFAKQQKVLGMPKHKRWIMLANYADITMLRNDVAYHISDMTSLKWAPNGHHVELVYNNVYSGTYYLCEQVRVDKDRVAITELPKNADGTTNNNVAPDKVGYLVEFDFHADATKYQWQTTFHHTKYGKQSIYLVKYPDEDELTQAQFDYIKGLVQDLETQLQTIKVDDSASEQKINQQYEEIINKNIDPLSFIDYWLVYEVCINHEILNPGSVYLHKDVGGKFFAGPTWDFDYGTFNFIYGEAQPAKSSLYVSGSVWYRYLFRNPKMKAMAKARWAELKPQLQSIPEYITKKADSLKYAAKENYAYWPMTINTNGDAYLTYEESINQMKKVFNERMQIIDRCMEEW